MIEDALEALAEREKFHQIVSALNHAGRQLARGDYTAYDADTISSLATRVKALTS